MRKLFENNLTYYWRNFRKMFDTVKACTHLCGLLCGQDHAQSASDLVDCAQSKFCTLNFPTTPISVAFFNRISKFLKPLLKMSHTGKLHVFCLHVVWPCWCKHHNLFLCVQSDRMRSKNHALSWLHRRPLKCVQALQILQMLSDYILACSSWGELSAGVLHSQLPVPLAEKKNSRVFIGQPTYFVILFSEITYSSSDNGCYVWTEDSYVQRTEREKWAGKCCAYSPSFV